MNYVFVRILNGVNKFMTRISSNIRQKIAVFIICAFVYLVLIALSMFSPLGKLYLFNWTFDNLYLFNWIPVIALIVFDYLPIAISITLGNFIGVFAGEFLGSFMRENAKSQITPDMSVSEAAAKLEANYGWAIWIIIVLCFTVVGVILAIVKKNGQKKQIL